MVLPNEITAQGWALAPIALATRPQGAPLTVILAGKRMPGTEDGPGRSCRRDHRRSVTAGTADLRKRGSPAWRRRRAPQGHRPKGRDMAAAPESGSSPTRPRLVPGDGARLSHASPLDDFASPACVRATGPARGVPKARP